jgi:hypothetical protein
MFEHIYKGDAHAARLSTGVLKAIHLWDDLIDRDKPVADSNINEVFLDLFCLVGPSPLWDADMSAHLLNVYTRWQAANVFESAKEEIDKAWMLRAGCYDLFVMLAAKLHGVDWGVEVAPLVYKTYGETLEQFTQEVQNA